MKRSLCLLIILSLLSFGFVGGCSSGGDEGAGPTTPPKLQPDVKKPASESNPGSSGTATPK